ncbi:MULTISPECIES: sulfurtransferase complex subunit TusD [Shewanella]|uniref:Sulfurtransferase complex subunit TusD n=1 Tax=Shewanella salipaludis TaxID=2723052 RepID=A0A972JK44_9GAMM|nr:MULTISPECIES: sulfurtransferase complex subunit TusD [Shewanella]MCE9687320.1 sulfurtransferase complex subunit TusD [Shewanella sp. AS16]NMH63967.1 sulfurtransferase complex subunit TusD [Shewanella salipaludis]
MSKFIVQVNSPAYGSAASMNAYRFTKAAQAQGHSVIRVFFYQDGVFNSNALNCPASDEFDLTRAWTELANDTGLELVNCVSAALRRGILSEQDARENAREHWNLASPFVMGGLGELVTGIEQADRVVSF